MVDFRGVLGTIALASDLPVIDNSVTINADGATLWGAGAHRGLLAFSGVVAINDLTIANALAHGGNTGVDGGGGGGLGGGLFVASDAHVGLSGVTFSGDAAAGGFPQAIIPGPESGGGGMGGDGIGGGGGGGGLGRSAAGGFEALSFPGLVNGTSGVGLGLSSAGAGSGAGAGAGGASGGGGGGAGTSVANDAGGGGGVGGTAAVASTGGDGGFGGGGGPGGNSAGAGGAGGFGGAGGAGGTAGPGGQGGFGGGGGGFGSGGTGAAGGFGAGNGGSTGLGGGGAGMGGAIFVMQGGQLTLNGPLAITGSSVAGGSNPPVIAGSAFGAGVFLQGTGGSLSFSPGSGQTESVSDVIADQTGVGGTGANAGSWALAKSGAGTLSLSAASTYSGGTTGRSVRQLRSRVRRLP